MAMKIMTVTLGLTDSANPASEDSVLHFNRLQAPNSLVIFTDWEQEACPSPVAVRNYGLSEIELPPSSRLS